MEVAIIPCFIIRKCFPDEEDQIHANVLMTSILLILGLVCFRECFFHVSLIPHFCVFQKFLNIPCPGCGVTRSLLTIAEWNILAAWDYNPAGLFLFLYFVVQIPLRITALRFQNTRDIIYRMSQIGSLSVVIVLFLVWFSRLN